MTHPAWLLVPWAVFALAGLLKLWQITAAIRRRLGVSNDNAKPRNSEEARAMLERVWRSDSPTRG